MLTTLNGNRGYGVTDLVNDPIAIILLDPDPQKRHPSPSQIREHREEATVVPFVLSEAVYFLAPDRRTETSPILHFSNTEQRPKFYNRGFNNNDPDQVIQIYTHDWSEDLSLGKVSGDYAIARIVEEIFGPRHYDAHLALTNVRGTMSHQLKKRLRRRGQFTATAPQDVLSSLEYLKKRVASYEDQTKAYDAVRKSAEAYKKAIDSFNWWSQEDKREGKDIADGLLQTLNRLSNGLIPVSTIGSLVAPYLSDFEDYVTVLVPNQEEFAQDQRSILNPNCQLRGRESPLIHMIGHLQYGGEDGSYMDELLDFSIRQATLNPMASKTMGTKRQEAADNFRKEAEMTASRQHITYERGMDTLLRGDLWLAHLIQTQSLEVKVDRLVQDFAKIELLQRVIKDYTNVATEPDADYESHGLWLVDQYRRVKRYVGPEVERSLLAELEAAKNSSIERRRRFAEKLLAGYNELEEIVNGKSRGQGIIRGLLQRVYIV